MRPVRGTGLGKGLVAAVAATTMLGVTAGLTTGGASAAPGVVETAASTAKERPALRVMSLTGEAEARKRGKRVYLELRTHLVAGNEPFEVLTQRAGYRTVPQTRIGRDGPALDPRLGLSGFGPLRDFLRLTVWDREGRRVLNRTSPLCLNRNAAPTRPGAAETGDYPYGCRTHPFGYGQVQGIADGWAIPLPGGRVDGLRVGRYDLQVVITPQWRDLIGISRHEGSKTLMLRVRDAGGCGDCREQAQRVRTDRTLRPAAQEPASDGGPPPDGTPLPDLRALPAFGIGVSGNGNYLRFAANVWNAGPSPLVVDGFRRQGQDVMDAHQYFYDIDGERVGHAEVGTMEWDDRDRHHHWHFTDFARYRLLDGNLGNPVRSKKEAFCLAATDSVDMTVPGALYRPWNTDLHSACGGYGSLAVREVLSAGSGDTYSQYRPGQSFPLQGIEPGIYFIEVTGNPDGNPVKNPGASSLYERRYDNNTAYRRIRIGGTDGNHWVKVFKKGLVSYN